MRRARLGLASLWLSQVTRVLADWGLRIAAFLHLRDLGETETAWYLVTAAYVLPFVLLAPFTGALSNALPRRGVLFAASFFCLLAVAFFLPQAPLDGIPWPGGPWVWALCLIAIGSALHNAARYAMLPAVAEDARLPLTTVNGWIELGSVSAIVGGAVLGLQLTGVSQNGVPEAVVAVLVLNVISLVTTLPCHFASDVRRPEPAWQAMRGFFKDCRRVFADRWARNSLLGLSVFQGLVTAGSGAVVMLALDNQVSQQDAALEAFVLVTIGVVIGCALAGLQGNPWRSLGLIPYGLVGMTAAQVWTALSHEQGIAPAGANLLFGFMGGLISVPLRANYQLAVPADARGNAMSVMNTVISLITTAIALTMLGLIRGGVLQDLQAQLWFIAGVLLLGAILAWRWLLTPALETIVEGLAFPMYRIRMVGPGARALPTRGPLLIVANHTSYFDPVWIAKHTPRHIRPMMMAKFYDLPVVRWLMTRVVRAFRVSPGKFRREVPELREVIADLKGGGCVLIFPEGILRRKEERILRMFGQGVWHILREVPEAQVAVCWIEGGWGSYASYWNGPPMSNKKRDFRRHIDIAVETPQPLPSEVLADHRSTRRYLMRVCLGARRHLGLEVPALDELNTEPDRDDAESAEPEADAGRVTS